MKRLFVHLADRWDAEARTPSDRAIPDLDLPTLTDLGHEGLLSNQRRLAVVFAGRVAAGLAAIGCALSHGSVPLLLLGAYLTYGGALTTVHHLIHGPLGLPNRWRGALRSVLAAVVLESGTALYATHTLHHSGDDTDPDPEGAIELVPWRRLPFEAMGFRYRLMTWGWRNTEQPGRVRVEVGFHIGFHVLAIALLPFTWYPAAYAATMFVASSGFALLAARGPQTNFGRPVRSPLVAVRGHVSRLLFFSHDRHLEHHAYPHVPLPRLRHLDADLADRWGHVTATDGRKLTLHTVRFV